MQRKKFLKDFFISASFFPMFIHVFKKERSFAGKNNKPTVNTDCGLPLTPAVNEGPFYINEQLNRSRIADAKEGVPLTLIFTIEDIHCRPIQGAIMDIWHCDKDGSYSDVRHEGTEGQKWLRGFQSTDVNGKCTFQTIFPGWYDNRLTHIHGKVKLGSITKQTTNFFLPKEIEQAVYNSAQYRKGQNPVTVSEDIELKGDSIRHQELMMSVTGDLKNGYVAAYTIAII